MYFAASKVTHAPYLNLNIHQLQGMHSIQKVHLKNELILYYRVVVDKP